MSQPVEFELEVESSTVLVEVDGYTAIVEIDKAVAAPHHDEEPVVIFAATPGIPGPPGTGGGGGGSPRVYRQSLTGAQNGVNMTFTTGADFIAGSTVVFRNGLMEVGYSESGTHTVVFQDPPSSFDILRIEYSTP